MRTLLLAGGLSILLAIPAHANESAYSERDLDRCTSLSETDEGPSVSMKCAGHGDLPV